MAVRYITVTPITNLFKPATRAFGDVAIVGDTAAAATGPKKTPIPITNPDSVSDASNPAGQNKPVDDALGFRGALGASVRKAWSNRPDQQPSGRVQNRILQNADTDSILLWWRLESWMCRSLSSPISAGRSR